MLYFLPLLLVVVYYANCVFLFFLSKARVSMVFHLAVLFRFYRLLAVVPRLSCVLNKYKDDGDDHEIMPATLANTPSSFYKVVH